MTQNMTQNTNKTLRAYNKISGAFLGEWTGATEQEIRQELADGFGVSLEDLSDEILIEEA